MCGSIHCDPSALTGGLQFVNFEASRHMGSPFVSFVGSEVCVAFSYPTFYNGPGRTDPGLAPDGASCGTGKVRVLEHLMHLRILL